MRARVAMQSIAMGYLLLNLANVKSGVAFLPLQFFLKDVMRLQAGGAATLIALVSIPWFVKPLAGLVLDSFAGRTTYTRMLIVSAFGASILWALLSAAGTNLGAVALVLLLLNCALVFCQTSMGGQLVSVSKALDASGRLNASRTIAESVASLSASPLGAMMAHSGLVVGAWTSALILVCQSFVSLLTKDILQPLEFQQSPRTIELKALFKLRDIWLIGLLFVLVRFTPALQTPLFYLQTQHLHFSANQIAWTRVVGSAAGILAGVAYFYACRVATLKQILTWTCLGRILALLLYVEYGSLGFAFVIESFNGITTAVMVLALADCISRSAPRGAESTTYALVFALGNLSWTLSDVIGSVVIDTYRSAVFIVLPGVVFASLAFWPIKRLSQGILQARERV